MPHVPPVDRRTLPEFELVFANAAKALGETPNSMLTMAHKPGLLGAFAVLSGTVFHKMRQPFSLATLRFFAKFLREARRSDPGNEISPALAQLVAYACSLSAGCRYCQAHTAGAAALAGVPDEKVEALLHFDTSPHFSDAERAALDLAFAAGRVPNEASAEHFAALRRHFNERQIVEIVGVIATMGFLNRWNDTMATALEGHPRGYAEAHLGGGGWAVGKHG